MFYTTALILLYLDTHNTALVEDFFLNILILLLMFILAIMIRLLLTIIKTDFQHDYNTGLDEAGFLCFITNEDNDNKHYD